MFYKSVQEDTYGLDNIEKLILNNIESLDKEDAIDFLKKGTENAEENLELIKFRARSFKRILIAEAICLSVLILGLSFIKKSVNALDVFAIVTLTITAHNALFALLDASHDKAQAEARLNKFNETSELHELHELDDTDIQK